MTKINNILTEVEARHHIRSLYREVFTITDDSENRLVLTNKVNDLKVWWTVDHRRGGYNLRWLRVEIERNTRCLEVSL